MVRWRHGVALLLAVSVVALPLTANAYVRPGDTQRINLTIDGTQTGGGDEAVECVGAGYGRCSENPRISGDGRFVAFPSYSSRLVEGDLNASPDTFVRDLGAGTTRLVSASTEGTQQICAEVPGLSILGCVGPTSISHNGRYISFVSGAPNLVVPDTNLQPDLFLKDMRTGVLRRVSVSSEGVESNGRVGQAVMSQDGRFILFDSDASNLVADDTNGVKDVFLRDLKRDTTDRISIGWDGSEADGETFAGSISYDGRFIAFAGHATNIVDDDTNQQSDVFLFDRQKGTTERVSLRSDGSQVPPYAGHSGIDASSISRDGRFILFRSNTTSLVPNAELGCHYYLRDTLRDRTERVSVRSDGTEATGYGVFIPHGCGPNTAITPNGRFIFFDSNGQFVADDQACNAPQGPSGENDAHVYDRLTGQVDLISRATDGTPASAAPGCSESGWGNPSDDGRLVAFDSSAPNLVPGDTNGLWDVFVRDRGLPLSAQPGEGGSGGTEDPPSGTVCLPDPVGCIASPGAALVEAFRSESGDLPPVADLVGARIAFRPDLADLFFALDVRTMKNLVHLETEGLVYTFAFQVGSKDYEIRAVQSVLGATFGLFRCDGSACSEISKLKGGFGTTGSRIVVSLPLSLLGEDGVVSVTEVSGHSARGIYLTGSLVPLDEIAL